MEDQLITFETAKLAKEKGFDVLSFYYYNDKSILTEPYIENGSSTDVEFRVDLTDFLENKNYKHSRFYSAPTQSLLQRWLREEHKFHIEISIGHDENCIWYNYSIYSIKLGYDYESINLQEVGGLDSYEQALEAGLQEGLKLIK